MKKIILILSCQLLVVHVCFCDNLYNIKKIETNKYMYNNYTFITSTYRITNTSNESLILWLDFSQNEDITLSFQEYFFAKKGDFSILDVVTDANMIYDDCPLELFKTFFKIIRKDEYFDICVISICDSMEAHNEYLRKLLNEYIKIISESESSMENSKILFHGFKGGQINLLIQK